MMMEGSASRCCVWICVNGKSLYEEGRTMSGCRGEVCLRADIVVVCLGIAANGR